MRAFVKTIGLQVLSAARQLVGVAGELWGNLPQTYSMAGIVNTGHLNLRLRDKPFGMFARLLVSLSASTAQQGSVK
jgi:hypothetical protein